ncbi:FliH/SctL family protein [Parvularcula lutaonensis]|uniref:Flagellar assembly protein FliH/Type III secretion system HrpE domain-containing protein n=1 Tax=Parvularcula lutaonensis TaxID=491923 RepID=A0ABV7MFS3_9PROT|nr:hypothetical protein [Parvularcula lutaonensis]GGY50612.1 hypothetical protein GCM10007148_19270 [Parvularcula lutaonensis]
MTIRAFAPVRDFNEPQVEEQAFEEVPEEDDRLSPEEVTRLIESAAAAARREGYEEGKRDGEEAERASMAARLEEKVDRLRAEIESIQAREDALFDELETRSSRLMLALVHQLARRLSEEEAKHLAENVTIRAIEAVRGKHRITIRATEEFLGPLRHVLRLPTDEEADQVRIHFEQAADETEAPLEVAWLTGKVTFDPYAFTGAIDEVFTETLKSLMDGEGTPSSEGENP